MYLSRYLTQLSSRTTPPSPSTSWLRTQTRPTVLITRLSTISALGRAFQPRAQFVLYVLEVFYILYSNILYKRLLVLSVLLSLIFFTYPSRLPRPFTNSKIAKMNYFQFHACDWQTTTCQIIF